MLLKGQDHHKSNLLAMRRVCKNILMCQFELKNVKSFPHISHYSTVKYTAKHVFD